MPAKISSLIEDRGPRAITVLTNSWLTRNGGTPKDTLLPPIKNIYYSFPIVSDEHYVWDTGEVLQL